MPLRHRLPALSLLSLLALAACQPPAPTETPQPRPVRLMTVQPAAGQSTLELAGAVHARVESVLGFRVAGKVTARSVDLGQTVRKGDVLLRLDARDYELAVTAARSAQASAKAALEVAQNEYRRFTSLKEKGLVSEADVERRRVELNAAQAQLASADSNAALASNRVEDTLLRADSDGVVTALQADVGTVLAAGQPVLTLAQAGEREIEVAFPEDRIALAHTAQAQVRLWAHPEQSWPASLRELSAAADPVTRTFRARYRVQTAASQLALGQSATVQLQVQDAPLANSAAQAIPLTALVHVQGQDAVWRYDSSAGEIRLTPVRVAGNRGNQVLVLGLSAGMQVATAGTHILSDHQKVRPLPEVTTGSAAP